jgi:hypothetical protein
LFIECKTSDSHKGISSPTVTASINLHNGEKAIEIIEIGFNPAIRGGCSFSLGGLPIKVSGRLMDRI